MGREAAGAVTSAAFAAYQARMPSGAAAATMNTQAGV
jgi:hypothetical protein